MNTIQQVTVPVNPPLPGGISFIAALNIIAGIVMTIGVFTDGYSSNEAWIWLIAGLASIAVGSGLLNRQRWALVVAIGGYVFNILLGLASQNPIALIVPAAILYYLCTAKVRAAFFAPPAPLAPPRATEAQIDVETDAKKA